VLFNFFDFFDFFNVHFILGLVEPKLFKEIIGFIHGLILLFSEFSYIFFLLFFFFNGFEVIVVSFLDALVIFSGHGEVLCGELIWVVDKIIIKGNRMKNSIGDGKLIKMDNMRN
jgi:hypothetical protein